MVIGRIYIFLCILTIGCSNLQGDADQQNAGESIVYSQYPFPMWNDTGGQQVLVYEDSPHEEANSQKLQGIIFNGNQIGINADGVLWIKGWVDVKDDQDVSITFTQADTEPSTYQVKNLIWKMSDGSWNAYSASIKSKSMKKNGR